MYRKILSLLAFAALAAGCLNQPADPQVPGVSGYTFTVEVDNPVFIYTEPTKSVISTQDGSISLPLTYKVTEGIDVEPRTKATQYNSLDPLGVFKVTAYDGDEKLIEDKEVKKSKNGWKLADDPKTWKEGHSMNFFAYANLPEGSSIGNVTSSSQTFNCTIQSTAAKQGDALLGYYSGYGNRKGEAALKFNHPLTAVVFKIGDIVAGDKTHTVTGIDSVSLTGVYASGTAVATGSDGCLSYSWTPGSGTITVSEPLTGPVETVGDAFLLIPQNLSEHPVTVEAVLTTTSGTKVSQAVLNTGEWIAGKTNTYVLGYTDYIDVESISLSKSSTTIKQTDNETLVATILPADASDKTVKWTSSDESVAKVDNNGKVTAVGEGSCYITATPADKVTPATCQVDVTNPVIDYQLQNVPTETLVFAADGSTQTFDVVSYMVKYGDKNTRIPVLPKVSGLPTDNWVVSNVIKKTGSDETDCTYSITLTVKNNDFTQTHSTKLKDAAPKGTASNPIDLSRCNPATGEGYRDKAQASSQKTANCYVVDAPGYYKFPLKQGNSATDVAATNADVLWSDGSVIAVDGVADGYIKFHIDKDKIQQANALIAGRNSNKTIQWSWHIWITDEDLTKKNTAPYDVIMPVNLGWVADASARISAQRGITLTVTSDQATGDFAGASKQVTVSQNAHPSSAASETGTSPFYQWGRKDPFRSSSSAYKNITHLSLSVCIQDPSSLYWMGDTNEKWCDDLEEEFWSEKKTLYDPSPVGYKVLSKSTAQGSFKSFYGILPKVGRITPKDGFDSNVQYYWVSARGETTYYYFRCYTIYENKCEATYKKSESYFAHSIRPEFEE